MPASRTRRLLRWLATAAVVLVALLVGALVWQYYVLAPWTRDGQVRVQVAAIAPEVSGRIIELHVADNQRVAKGDVLYVIDPFDYRAALDAAKAEIDNRTADLQVKRAQAARREALSINAVSPEEKQQYQGTARIAEAASATAQTQLARAERDLERTRVVSPVNGYVTNLQLRAGDYASAGMRNISVVDADSYWVDGYFEETKLAQIRVGAPARADLMGYDAPLRGRVESITRGIATGNAASSTQGLPGVDPVYTWVRLAQRVPVRIAIEAVPDGIPLIAGTTATVTVQAPGIEGEGFRWSLGALGANLRLLFGGQRLPADAARTTRTEGARPAATVPQVAPPHPPAPASTSRR